MLWKINKRFRVWKVYSYGGIKMNNVNGTISMFNGRLKDLIEYLELAVGNIKAIERCDNGGDMNDLLQNLDTLMELINEKWRNLK